MTSDPFPTSIHLKDPTPHPNARTYIIFFSTGNPGLISYYTTFLHHLYSILSSSDSSVNINFQVYGASLSGFDVHGRDQDSIAGNSPPYGLRDQIDGVSKDLRELVMREWQDGRRNGRERVPRVVLVGHSVGAYILMEIIRCERAGSTHRPPGVDILGGVCLTPTVVDIAKSKSGRLASPLLTIPYYPLLASLLVKVLTFWIPVRALQSLVRLATGFPADAAAVTAAFIKSKWGVRQSLQMARDEMETITADKWNDEIWGAAAPSSSESPRPPKLFFLFAKEDHWVADETRDELIKVRAAKGEGDEKWRPKMEVDESGIVHGFCIRHSVPVAEKVKGYIDEIVKADAATRDQ